MTRRCNKIPFEDKSSATKYLKFINSAYNTKPKKMHPYLCGRCSKWHLTSVKKVRSRLIKRTARLIKEFRALTSNDDRWQFIIRHQGKKIEVGIYDERTYVVFNGKVRVLFD